MDDMEEMLTLHSVRIVPIFVITHKELSKKLVIWKVFLVVKYLSSKTFGGHSYYQEL